VLARLTRGTPLRRNGWSAEEKTNGSTGKMHGLMMVSRPPMNAMQYSNMGQTEPYGSYLA